MYGALWQDFFLLKHTGLLTSLRVCQLNETLLYMYWSHRWGESFLNLILSSGLKPLIILNLYPHLYWLVGFYELISHQPLQALHDHKNSLFYLWNHFLIMVITRVNQKDYVSSCNVVSQFYVLIIESSYYWKRPWVVAS